MLKAGSIRPDTLVWREGMADWQRWSAVRHGAVPTGPGVAPRVCAHCGGVFPADQLITLQGVAVCAACKPVQLQKLKEGLVADGGTERLESLLRVAKAQKGVTWCILVLLLLYGGSLAGMSSGIPAASILMLGVLVVLPFQLIYVYRLASALEMGVPLLWVVGMFLSCIGLILLLILSTKATKALREAGFKVGLMGANLAEIERALGR
jgi:hypothetical protein